MAPTPPDDSPIQAKLAAPPPEIHEELGNGSRHSSESSNQNMFQSRLVVLGILFLVTGALGIPLLWMNPNFSTKERIVWTFVTLLYTVTLIVLAGGIVWWAYDRVIGTRGF